MSKRAGTIITLEDFVEQLAMVRKLGPIGNLLGMLPYSFTYTSHIIVTGALALGHVLPAYAQAFDPALRRVACDQRGVDCADRDADDPAWLMAHFDEAFMAAPDLRAATPWCLRPRDSSRSRALASACSAIHLLFA